MSRPLAILALASALASATARAQSEPTPTTTILIRPASEPVPALKYRIVPERRSLVPGNAAVFYHRAVLMIVQRQRAQAQARTGPPSRAEDPILAWLSGPLGEIPRDKAREYIQSFSNALREAELGAVRQTCDWEFDARDEGFSLLLPDIQEMRTVARLVALRARLAVLDGKPDEAFHWLQVGSTMARHTGQGPIVIQGLVGVAMLSLLNRAFEDLIQAPGAPDLYWALANRPRPFIDLAANLEGDVHLIEHELPALRDLDAGPWTLERAFRFADDLMHKLGILVGGFPNLPEPDPAATAGSPPRLRDMPARLTLAGMVMMTYPDAKRALIARGKPAAEVEAMPAVQAAALATYWAFEQARDDVSKWFGLPYWQFQGAIDRTLSQPTADAKSSDPLLFLFLQTLPALNGVRLASVRADRQLDALQCIEAIRLYAASHDGKLPPTLAAITEAPAPIDPATGTPFDYKVIGATATLSAPLPPGAPDHPSYRLRYELKLAP